MNEGISKILEVFTEFIILLRITKFILRREDPRTLIIFGYLVGAIFSFNRLIFYYKGTYNIDRL